MKAISTEYFLSWRIEFSLLIRMCSTLAWIRHGVNKHFPDYDQHVFLLFALVEILSNFLAKMLSAILSMCHPLYPNDDNPIFRPTKADKVF